MKSTIQASTSTIADERDPKHQQPVLETKPEECIESVAGMLRIIEKYKNVYFLIIFEEEKVVNQEPQTESSVPESPKSEAFVPSPTLKKTCEEDSPATSDDFEQPPAKTEKGSSEEGFCCVMSMQDGVVLYTTPSITNSLGFPRDMWLGRSFIDFVHPKDR